MARRRPVTWALLVLLTAAFPGCMCMRPDLLGCPDGGCPPLPPPTPPPDLSCYPSIGWPTELEGIIPSVRAGSVAELTSLPGPVGTTPIAAGASLVLAAYGPLARGAAVSSSDTAVVRVDTVVTGPVPSCRGEQSRLGNVVWTRLTATVPGHATLTFSDVDGFVGTAQVEVAEPVALVLGRDFAGRWPAAPVALPMPPTSPTFPADATVAVWVDAVDGSGRRLAVGGGAVIASDDASVAGVAQPTGDIGPSPLAPLPGSRRPFATITTGVAGATTIHVSALGLAADFDVRVAPDAAADAATD